MARIHKAPESGPRRRPGGKGTHGCCSVTKPRDPLFIKALSQLSEGTSDILLQPSACLQKGGDGGAEVNPRAPPSLTDRAPTERLTRLWALHLGTPGVPGPFEGQGGDTEAQRDDSTRHTAGRLWSF